MGEVTPVEERQSGAAEVTDMPIQAEPAAGSSSAETAEPGNSGATGDDDVMPAGSEESILTDDSRSDTMRQITADWKTNWNRHTIPYDELTPVLLRDAIRSIDDPKFDSLEQAAGWLEDGDPVIAVDLNGEARAYPLRILTAHEIVNDSISDLPILVTYCPLCNSALVFERRVNGEAVDFGTTGWLRNSDLIMYDRTTESLWQQFTGEAIVGDEAGTTLTFLPSSLVSFSDFRDAFPDGVVLSDDTGFRFSYDLKSYQGYDTIDGDSPFLFYEDIDPRLPATERVVSLSFDDLAIAYPVSQLSEVGVINDSQNGRDLAIFHTFGTSSAFFNPLTLDWEDVGATGVFDPNLDGRKLSFSVVDSTITDDQTGSSWNILGQVIDGPLVGKSLEPVIHGDHFWFSWAAFHPDTLIYGE